MLPAHSTRERNPYTWLLATALERLGVHVIEFRSALQVLSADIVHLHWPEEFLNKRKYWHFLRAMATLMATLALCRIRKVPLVWTVHNLHPHEHRKPRAIRWFYRTFPTRVNGMIFLSEASREQASAAGLSRGSTSAVIPHGHYLDVLPRLLEKSQASALLGLPCSELRALFFGAIRPYKNVVELVRAFPRSGAATLHVVGSTDTHPEMATEIIDASSANPSVVPVLGWMESETLAVWLRACDVAILPFRDVTNSGSVLMALSAGLPVATRERGSMRELQEIVGSDWLYLFGEGTLAEEIDDVLEWAGKKRGTPPRLGPLGWDPIAAATLALYARVLFPPDQRASRTSR